MFARLFCVLAAAAVATAILPPETISVDCPDVDFDAAILEPAPALGFNTPRVSWKPLGEFNLEVLAVVDVHIQMVDVNGLEIGDQVNIRLAFVEGAWIAHITDARILDLLAEPDNTLLYSFTYVIAVSSDIDCNTGIRSFSLGELQQNAQEQLVQQPAKLMRAQPQAQEQLLQQPAKLMRAQPQAQKQFVQQPAKLMMAQPQAQQQLVQQPAKLIEEEVIPTMPPFIPEDPIFVPPEEVYDEGIPVHYHPHSHVYTPPYPKMHYPPKPPAPTFFRPVVEAFQIQPPVAPLIQMPYGGGYGSSGGSLAPLVAPLSSSYGATPLRTAPLSVGYGGPAPLFSGATAPLTTGYGSAGFGGAAPLFSAATAPLTTGYGSAPLFSSRRVAPVISSGYGGAASLFSGATAPLTTGYGSAALTTGYGSAPLTEAYGVAVDPGYPMPHHTYVHPAEFPQMPMYGGY